MLRWNQPQDWVISRTMAHPALVSEADFVAAQAITAIPIPADGAPRTYALVGLVRCQTCGRRMDSHWVHGRPGYRCRHGHTSAKPTTPDRPKTLYLHEDHILARIALSLEHVGLPDPAEMANYLHAHSITILCDTDTCTLNTGSPTSQLELQLII